MTKLGKRISATLGSGFVMSILLIGLVYWVLVTGRANSFLAQFLSNELTAQLEMPCQIGDIEGNPLGRYRALNVKIGSMFRADTIGVRFEPKFGFRIHVDSLLMKGFEVSFDAQASTDPSEQAGLENIATTWPFEVSHVLLQRGRIQVSPTDTLVMDQFRGKILADGSRIALTVLQYQSHIFTPPLQISQLQGLGVLEDGRVSLTDVQIGLPNSRLSVNGTFENLQDPKFSFQLQADPLAFADFRYWIDEGIPEVVLRGNGHIEGQLDDIQGALDVSIETTMLHLAFRGGIVPLALQLEGNASLSQFNLGVVDSILAGSSVGGQTTFSAFVDSNGIQTADFEGQFGHLVYRNVNQTNTRIQLTYDNGVFRGNMASQGNLSDFELRGLQTSDFLQLEGFIQALDLKVLPEVGVDLVATDGRFIVNRDSVWHSEASVGAMTLNGTQIKDFRGKGIYGPTHASLDTFGLELPQFGTQIEGSVRAMSPDFRDLDMSLNGKTDMVHMTGTDALGRALIFEGTVQGNLAQDVQGEVILQANISEFEDGLDSLRVEAQLDLAQRVSLQAQSWGNGGRLFVDGSVQAFSDLDLFLRGDLTKLDRWANLWDLKVVGDSLQFEGNVGGKIAAPKATLDVSLPHLEIADVPLDDVVLSTEYSRPDHISLVAKAGRVRWAERDLRAVYLQAQREPEMTHFVFGSDPQFDDRFFVSGEIEDSTEQIWVLLDSLHVQASDVAFYNRGALSFLYDLTRGFHIEQFELDGVAGRIIARNHPDLQTAIEVVLEDIDLRPWAFLLGQQGIRGVYNAEVAFSGELSDPLIFLEGKIEDAEGYGVRTPKITTNLSYGDKRVLLDVVADQGRNGKIEISGSLPVEATDRVVLDLRADALALSLFDTLISQAQIQSGMVSGRVQVRGQLEKPQLNGEVKIVAGKIYYPNLGRVYDPIDGQFRLMQDKVVVDSLIVGKKGKQLRTKGELVIGKESLDRFDLSFNFEQFEALQWPEVSGEITGALRLQGAPNRARIDGDLKVGQTDIRLGELMAAPSSGWENTPFVQGLQMSVSILADQQVWVRDPTFNIEMLGDLDLIKDSDGFKVFGVMQSRRGSYIFQSRRLEITKGEIQFQGKKVVDPNLDIQAQTRVMARLNNANTPEPVVIYVQVGGTLSHPQIQLTSDSAQLGNNFEDIVSVMLIGTTRENASLAVENASDMVLSALANRVGQRIGEDLNLDLVEVDVAESNISRVRVGKYVTPRLFVSYAQEMGSTGREIALEFKLLPSLTLEARQIDAGNEEQLIQKTRESIGIVWQKDW